MRAVRVSDALQPARRIGQRHHGADGHPRLLVTTDAGKRFDVAAVLICAGAGAFAPQRVSLPEAAALEDRHVHYAVRDVSRFAGKRVIVAGGGDSALDWALALRKVAARVTLLHRREGFRAADTRSMRCARPWPPARWISWSACSAAPDRWRRADRRGIKTRDGEQTMPADELVALYGLVSEPGPIAQWDWTCARAASRSIPRRMKARAAASSRPATSRSIRTSRS
jgi:thioredoxin reductase (NADPH)